MGPVRMRFACRSPDKLHDMLSCGSMGRATTSSWSPRSLRRAVVCPPPPSPPSNDKGPGNKDADQDQDESMGDDSIDTAAWDKLGLHDKSLDKTACDTSPTYL